MEPSPLEHKLSRMYCTSYLNGIKTGVALQEIWTKKQHRKMSTNS